MMVAMAGLQVFIVRFFFQGARKGGHRSLLVSKSLAHSMAQVMFRCCSSNTTFYISPFADLLPESSVTDLMNSRSYLLPRVVNFDICLQIHSAIHLGPEMSTSNVP